MTVKDIKVGKSYYYYLRTKEKPLSLYKVKVMAIVEDPMVGDVTIKIEKVCFQEKDSKVEIGDIADGSSNIIFTEKTLIKCIFEDI